MASPTTTTTTTATTAFMERLTYRCHCCNCDVSPSPSSSSSSSDTTISTTSLLCPNCNCDCLEQVISNNNPNPNYPNQHSSQLSFPSFDPSIPTTTADSSRTFPFPSVTASDDNFLLDSPYLHRLINHLTNSSDSSPSTTTVTTSLHHSPTSKSAIEAIPLVKITSAFLDIDPIVLCAVCKDQFVIDDETKQLPFAKRTDVDDEAMLGIGFSNLQHQYMHSEFDPDVMFPLTHIGQTVEVDVLPDSGQDNGLETQTPSWPNWRVNGVAVDGGDTGVNGGWIDDSDSANSMP
ncbi:unnamed protein product [Lactuca saligna]|uniref:Uncharacterized protein n=1 Tax=Lactuca saligna TaxID=75948 RepID=A0AA35ZIY9_LACSI|nr:unnamed protein product [Lactuca saligna]